MITCSFFDHKKYPAQEFINRDKDFIGNGVLKSTDFDLTCSGLSVDVGVGTAWVNGYRIGYDANPVINLSFSDSDPVNPRIDLVEVGYSGSGMAGRGEIKVITGTHQANPIQPQPDAGFIGIFAVSIAAGATNITSEDVTDLRMGISIAGATNTPLATVVPGVQGPGTSGSVGISPHAARADHVHPMQNILPADIGAETPEESQAKADAAQTAAETYANSIKPTKTSELTNDSGYITSAPIQSVNGKTGAVMLVSADVGAETPTGAQAKANAAQAAAETYADSIKPTKTSQLTNDSGYITSSGASVQSVNGKTGAVMLVAADVGAETPTGAQAKANAARDAAITALSSHFGLEIDAADSRISGTKKPDVLCWNVQCVYKNTVTSGAVELANVVVNNLRFGIYTLVLRLKSSNNTITTDSIKVEVQKNNAGTFTTVASRQIKPTEFSSTAQYSNFYIEFEYTGSKATNNELKILITLLSQSAVYEVDLDSLVVLPKVIGVFFPNS